MSPVVAQGCQFGFFEGKFVIFGLFLFLKKGQIKFGLFGLFWPSRFFMSIWRL